MLANFDIVVAAGDPLKGTADTRERLRLRSFTSDSASCSRNSSSERWLWNCSACKIDGYMFDVAILAIARRLGFGLLRQEAIHLVAETNLDAGTQNQLISRLISLS